MCCLMCNNSNQYVQEEKFQNNNGMGNFDFNTPSM